MVSDVVSTVEMVTRSMGSWLVCGVCLSGMVLPGVRWVITLVKCVVPVGLGMWSA